MSLYSSSEINIFVVVLLLSTSTGADFVQRCENITILQNNVLESNRSFTLLFRTTNLGLQIFFYDVARDITRVHIVDDDCKLKSYLSTVQ